MKNTFVASMAVLHTWCGLVCGWIMVSVFLTGALAVFWMEIGDWGTPAVFTHPPVARAQAIERGIDYLSKAAPGADQWRLVLPNSRDRQLGAAWDPPGAEETVKRTLDPATGGELRQSEGGWFFVYFHYRLHLMGKDRIGFWLVGAASAGMLVSILSGVFIHRRIFRDFFLLRWWSSPQRAWTDVHNVLGVLPLPFHVMIILSGLAITAPAYLPPLTRPEPAKAAPARPRKPPTTPASTPLASVAAMVADADRRFPDATVQYLYVVNPGRPKAVVRLSHQRDDRVRTQVRGSIYDGATGRYQKGLPPRPPAADTQFFLRGLHFAQFGGAPVRWGFFLSGLAGAGMMAAGLTLFAAKRRARAEGRITAGFYLAAERVNVAAIAGPLVASVAYLWGMRLWPASTPDRPQHEIDVFYVAMAISLVHALLRPARKGWVEQLGVAAALCLALPLADVLDPGMDLFTSAGRGLWTYSGVELVVLACGAGCAFAAWRIEASGPARPSPP